MARFRWTLAALLSHWRTHPIQFASLLIGLWLATTLWSGVQALNAQAKESYARAAALFGEEAHYLARQDGQRFPEETFVQLRLAGWPVTPILEGRIRLSEPESDSLQVIGFDPLTAGALGGTVGETALVTDLGALLTPPGRALIAPETLRELGLNPGDRPLTEAGRSLPPLTLQPGLAPGTLLLDIGPAQRLLDAEGLLSRLLLPPDFTPGTFTLPTLMSAPLILHTAAGEADLARLTDSFHLNLTALGLLAFVVGLFIVHAAIGLALEQRLGLLRTLRACGVSARMVLAALATELLALALLGGLAGVATGYLLAALLLPDVAASLRGLYGAVVPGELALSPRWWFTGIAMALLGALAAGFAALLKAARLPLLALAQPEAWRAAQARWLRRQRGAAAVLALLALVAWLGGDSLLAGFALLAALLLAAALALPVLLSALLDVALRLSRRPLAQWLWADSRQQLPGLSLALMALLLALTANVGVGTMTEGFRATFTGWLDQRLAAELYVRPESPGQATALKAWLEAQGEVSAVLESRQTAITLDGWPVEITALPDHATFRDAWPLLTARRDGWEQWARQEAVFISEQLAFRLALAPGDPLTLPTPQGPWSVTVAGIYADYGNPRGQLLVNAAGFVRHWPAVPLFSFNVRLPAEAAPALTTRLIDQFGIAASRVSDQASLKAWSTRIFDRTFAATAALNTLTLAVAGIALFTSLLTLSHARLPQLAPLWATGVSRPRLAWLNLAQTLTLALLTALLAIPLGLLLAWVLVAVINVHAFGWRLPLHLFPGQLAALVGLALLAALLAAAGPLWRLRRIAPARLLSSFINER